MRREEEAGISAIAAELTDVKCVLWDSPVDIGDECRVAVEFKYQGPATTKLIYAAIGNAGIFGFDEILAGSKNLDIPYMASLTTIITFVYIPITSAIDPAGSPYDLYSKVDGLFPEISPFYENVIVISGAIPPPDYRNLEIVSYSPTELSVGDSLQITFRVEHIGEAQTGTLYAAIGVKDTWFDEILKNDISVSFPESEVWESKTMNISIPITQVISSGEYEFYAKLIGVTGPDLYVYSPQNVLAIEGIPPEVVLSGIITRIEPLQFAVGQPIDLEIDFNAYMESLYYQIRGWETSLQAIVDGLRDSDPQTHYGRDGSRIGETLNLGAMPDRDLSGTLTLYGRGFAIPTQDWQELDSKDLVITREGVPPPPPCTPGKTKCIGLDLYECSPDGEWVLVEENAPECVEEEKKFPWVPVALIGGGIVVAGAALAKPKKKMT